MPKSPTWKSGRVGGENNENGVKRWDGENKWLVCERHGSITFFLFGCAPFGRRMPQGPADPVSELFGRGRPVFQYGLVHQPRPAGIPMVRHQKWAQPLRRVQLQDVPMQRTCYWFAW